MGGVLKASYKGLLHTKYQAFLQSIESAHQHMKTSTHGLIDIIRRFQSARDQLQVHMPSKSSYTSKNTEYYAGKDSKSSNGKKLAVTRPAYLKPDKKQMTSSADGLGVRGRTADQRSKNKNHSKQNILGMWT
jgi:hypothetical protein